MAAFQNGRQVSYVTVVLQRNRGIAPALFMFREVTYILFLVVPELTMSRSGPGGDEDDGMGS